MSVTLLLEGLCRLLVTSGLFFTVVIHAKDTVDFDWASLKSSTQLTWTQCYDADHQCTNFEVPLNYFDTTAGSAVIALLRLPAVVGANSTQYRGPILINPGGPGGSGVDSVLANGALLSQVFGPSFDFVGFDPRGVAHSTPSVQIFNEAAEKALWDFGGPSFKNAMASPDALPRQWALSQILGRKAVLNDPGILAHLTTDNVARDMLRIVEAHGREKLQYWADSYGTTLGVVFASMFPDRIERMVLDGVTDIDAYYKADWAGFLTGADKSLQVFFDTCHAAGKKACPFYASSPQEISQNMNHLLESVRKVSIPVYSADPSRYGLLDYATLKMAIWDSLSRPYSSFPGLAKGLADLAQGNATTILEFAGYNRYDTSLFDACSTGASPFDHSDEAGTAISCADAIPIDEKSAADLAKYLTNAQKISTFAEIFMSTRTQCTGWKVHPKSVFRGPFEGNTSHPILFVSNTADPVTPMANAVKRSKAFPGSVVLAQNSPGHTSLSATSPCLYQHVATYMITGTLPPVGTVCEVIDVMFAL